MSRSGRHQPIIADEIDWQAIARLPNAHQEGATQRIEIAKQAILACAMSVELPAALGMAGQIKALTLMIGADPHRQEQ